MTKKEIQRLQITGKKKDTEISNLKKEVSALKQVQTNFGEAQWEWEDAIKKKDTEIYNLQKCLPDAEALKTEQAAEIRVLERMLDRVLRAGPWARGKA